MRRAHLPLLAPLLLAALLASCAVPGTAPAPVPATAPCRAGEQAAISAFLYFGTDRPDGGVVDAQQWSGFVEREVAPRFPQGFTLFEAQGHWRNADGSVAHERTHVLQILYTDDARRDTELAAIAAAYKLEFRQEAVLRVRTAACMRFY